MNKIIEHLLVIEIYLACSITCVSMLNYKSLASLAIAVNFIVVFILFFITVLNQRYVNRSRFFAFLLTVVFSLISVLISSTSISFEYLKKWIMFTCTMMIYYCTAEVLVTARIVSALFRGSISIAICFIGMYLSGKQYWSGGAISFNLGNPNYTGICILCVLMCLFPFLKQKKNIKKYAFLSLLVVLVYFLLLTKARACILALGAYLVVLFWPNIQYKKWLTFLFLIFPLLFAIIYMQLISNDTVREIFSFLQSEGKTLTSRVVIWNNAFNSIRDNLLFGDYYFATGGTGLGQLHNLNLDILGAFGTITFSCMTIYLYKLINSIGEQSATHNQILCIYSYYALMIAGTFEAALYSNSQGMYVLSAGLFVMARYSKRLNGL